MSDGVKRCNKLVQAYSVPCTRLLLHCRPCVYDPDAAVLWNELSCSRAKSAPIPEPKFAVGQVVRLGNLDLNITLTYRKIDARRYVINSGWLYYIKRWDFCSEKYSEDNMYPLTDAEFRGDAHT